MNSYHTPGPAYPTSPSSRAHPALTRGHMTTLAIALGVLLLVICVTAESGAPDAAAPPPLETPGVSPQGGMGAALAPADTPTPPTPSTTPTASADPSQIAPSLPGINLDPAQWVVQALGAAFSWLFTTVRSALADLLSQALRLDILAMTPPDDTYNHIVVQTLWRALAEVADAGVALITVVAGYNAMFGEAIGARYHSVREVLPRIILGGLGINLSLFLCQILIDLNNALCTLTADPLEQVIRLMAENGSGLAFSVLLLAFGVATLFLVVQMVVRLALLDLLIITAPLGMLCWIVPQTRAWAHLWVRTFVGTTLVQFLQILALAVGGVFIGIFQVDVNGPFAALMDLIIGIATVYLAIRMPALVRGFGGAGAPNPINDASGMAGTALVVSRLAALAAL